MKRYLQEQVGASLRAMGVAEDIPIPFEKPRQAGHGDLTTNIAMTLARRLGRSPHQLAADILKNISLDSTLVKSVEPAGPGFLNFTLTDKFYQSQLREIVLSPATFGRSQVGSGKRVQVEFVSANPTGPLTVGHGRGAVLGDTIANLLEWTGYNVEREYYYNNAGRQMRILGDSVRHRYLALLGDEIAFPEDYYQGEYIIEIARGLKEAHGDALRHEPPEGRFKEAAEREIFAAIRRTLDSLGIQFESYFNENSLYDDGKIEEVIGELKTRDLVYEKDGALWLKMSQLGGVKDKVIVKNTGEPTYRLPDIAYHREKFRRGYDLMIDVLGADHVATYPDVLAGLRALGFDQTKVKVLLHQFVTIKQEGEIVKMSTRKANYETLDDLIAEVGADVVRYFFIMRSMSSHLNFDVDLAKKESDENPVYYLQYAHARISGIIRKAEEQGLTAGGNAPCELLVSPEELALMKILLAFPETVESCALTYEPHRLAEYLHEMAGVFHHFYHVHRVIAEDVALSKARLALCLATRAVLRNGLAILGISAPERM